MKRLCIGLFGTCGSSRWRDDFVKRYELEGVAYYNPLVDRWGPDSAVTEADHLATDRIVLFPVTGETTGLASLSEIAFYIINCLGLEEDQDMVVYVEPGLREELSNTLSDGERDTAMRVRTLVGAHLKRLRLKNVHVVSSFDDMLEASMILWRSAKMRERLMTINER